MSELTSHSRGSSWGTTGHRQGPPVQGHSVRREATVGKPVVLRQGPTLPLPGPFPVVGVPTSLLQRVEAVPVRATKATHVNRRRSQGPRRTDYPQISWIPNGDMEPKREIGRETTGWEGRGETKSGRLRENVKTSRRRGPWHRRDG